MQPATQNDRDSKTSGAGLFFLLLLVIVIVVGGATYFVVLLTRGFNNLNKPGSTNDETTVVSEGGGNAAHGHEMFNMTCIACHGPAGLGIPTLGANLTQSKFIRTRSDAQLVTFLKIGRLPGDPNTVFNGTMPPKGGNPMLDEAGMHDVVAFLRTMQSGGVSTAIGPAAPVLGPIFAAANDGDLEKAKGLLKDHADLVSSKDDHGRTPLHLAAETGHRDLADLLLTNKAAVDAKDNDGATPLHLAAAKGYKNVVKLLVSSGADVNATDKSGATALKIATKNEHGDVAKYLEAHGGK